MLDHTPAELLRSAGRLLVWCVIAVLLVRGASDMLARHEPERGARPERSAVAPAWPDEAARAFAVQFAWAYLASSPQDRDEYARRLSDFATAELAPELLPQLVDRGARQVVQAATVAGSELVDDRHVLVTVAVRVAIAGRVSLRLLTVPVARDDAGGLVVYDLPSFAPLSSRAEAARPESQPLATADSAEIEDVLARFFRAYLAGAAEDLTYLVPPGVRIGAAAGRFELASLVSIAEPVPASTSRDGRLVLVTVQARDEETGTVYALRYRVRLVRRDRWYVAQVSASEGER